MQTVRSQQAPEGQGGYSCQTYYQSPPKTLQTEHPGDDQHFSPLLDGVPEHRYALKRVVHISWSWGSLLPCSHQR